VVATSENDVKFTPEEMERLFPFRMMLDAEARIKSSGLGVAKLFPGAQAGVGIHEVFHILEPSHLAWDPDIFAERKYLVLLESKDNGARLKGELLALDAGEFLFVGGPWAESLKVLAGLGLQFSELPIHQGTADLLFLLSSREIMLKDTRKLTETLERGNQRLNSILSNLPGIATRWELAGDEPNLEYLGQQIEQLTGYPAADFLQQGRRFESIVHRNDLSFVQEKRQRGIAAEEQFTIEYRVCARDGSEKWVLERGHVIMDGERKMLDGFIFDITNRVESERARLQAEQASEAKSQFLAKMSHEIRTPLNGLVGMASLLKDFSLSGDQRNRMVDTMIRSSEVLLAVINDILDLSKVESGNTVLYARPFCFHEAVQDAVAVIRTQAEDKGLVVTCAIGSGVPSFLVGDTVRLKQILYNLLSNAVKFTAQGRVHVAVKRSPAADAGTARVQVTVSDSGIGIPAAKRASLFQPFSQLDNSSTRMHQGAGLGLSIARHFAERMGGSLNIIDAHPGFSTSFELLLALPIAESQPGTLPVQVLSEPGSQEPPASSASLRVLLVEDIEVNRMVALGMIRRSGFEQVEVAVNGQQAVEIMREQPGIDIILMDLQMPVLDGITATRMILSEAKNNPPYIIGLTGNAMDSHRESCFEAGMSDFLAKPFTLPKFRSMMEQARRRISGAALAN